MVRGWEVREISEAALRSPIIDDLSTYLKFPVRSIIVIFKAPDGFHASPVPQLGVTKPGGPLLVYHRWLEWPRGSKIMTVQWNHASRYLFSVIFLVSRSLYKKTRAGDQTPARAWWVLTAHVPGVKAGGSDFREQAARDMGSSRESTATKAYLRWYDFIPRYTLNFLC